MQKIFSISCNTQNSLQLQKPLQDTKGTRELSAAREGERFPILMTEVGEQSQGSGRMQLPSQPQPHGAPLQARSPDPPTWGGQGQHAAPAPGAGMGRQEAIHGSPRLTAPKPLERSCCLRQGAAAQTRWGEARRQGKAGPSKTSSQDQEQGDSVLLGGLFLCPSQQLWKIREERTGNGSAGLLTCIQALQQPLLFPESKRQIVKGRARTCLPHCNVHKKQGGAQCAAPDPSAGPCPQQD